MKNKKAISLSLETIVVAVLILVVLIVLIMVFTGQFGKEADYTGDQIDCIKSDSDCDGVNDLIDKRLRGELSRCNNCQMHCGQ